MFGVLYVASACADAQLLGAQRRAPGTLWVDALRWAKGSPAAILISMGSIPRSLLRNQERAALFPGGRSPLESQHAQTLTAKVTLIDIPRCSRWGFLISHQAFKV